MAYPFCQKVYFRGFTMWALQCLKVFHVLKLLFTSEKTMGLRGCCRGGGGWGDRDHALSVVCVTVCIKKGKIQTQAEPAMGKLQYCKLHTLLISQILQNLWIKLTNVCQPFLAIWWILTEEKANLEKNIC